MGRFSRSWTALTLILVICACQPDYTLPPTLTPRPTLDPDQVARSCSAVDASWALGDWPHVIEKLETVRTLGGQCGGQDPTLMLYPAYYNYGAALDTKGSSADAIDAYRHALVYNPTGQEAALALKKHQALTPEPLATCSAQHVQEALAAIPVYHPVGTGGFMAIQGEHFILDGAPFAIHGVNYYPARAPWRRFLTDSTPGMMAHELDLIKGAGFNTIRIFLWYEALFECPGSGVIPNMAAFNRLDTALRLAAERGLHVLVTLHDLADLTFHPLYTEPDSPAAQTAYLLLRYRDEPTILGWDLRNEGDIDYIRGLAPASTVLDWLAHTAQIARALDTHHLITAGWNEDAQSTANIVDFVSFHHWSQPSAMHDRVAALRVYTQKPILLEEVGYSTRSTGEAAQADLLRGALDTAAAEGLAGWIVWTAFDYTPDVTCIPPACPGKDNTEHHFGLWRADYTLKPALSVILER